MGIVIAIIVVVVVVAIAGGVVLTRRKRATDSRPAAEPPPAPRTPRPEPAPMTGLEDALNKATDRTGSTMADRLTAEQDHVDQLRQPDDTGPLLRRALDSVDRGHDAPADAADAAPGDTGAADETPGTDRPDSPQA